MSQNESFDDGHDITLSGTGPGVSPRVLKPGALIGGSYRLKSLLGKGGMGYVFCAEHTMIKHDYAVKILAPELLNEESRRRFEIEGRAIANLDHPSIVKVYNMGLDAGECPFYVMDLLAGRALSDCIVARPELTFDECLDIFIQIAAGLGYAHAKGIIHRDVKPSNIILLADSSGRSSVKIVDFGIAKLLPSANLHSQSQTATGTVFGSPSYMSPEQCMGAPVDHRSDIYSLGCTLFETLCRQPPYRGHSIIATLMMHQNEPIPSILEARPEMDWPQSIDLLLAKMMAKRAENRYQSMEQLKHDLERIRQGKAIGKISASGKTNTAGKINPSGRSVSVPGDIGPGRYVETDAVSLFAEGDAGQETQEMADAPEVPGARGLMENSSGWLAGIAVSLVVLALFAGGGWFLMSHKGDRIGPASKVPDIAINPELEDSRKIARDCAVIKSVIVVRDGVNKRKLVFPAMSVGLVSNPGGKRVEAIGETYWPLDQPLNLEIGKGASRQVLFVPEVIDKIDPGEFTNLMLRLDKPDKFDEDAYTQTEAVVHILKAASHWSKLRFVLLEQCSITKEVLDCIDQFPVLQFFAVEHSKINAEALANQPFLRRLQLLRLRQVNHIRRVCHQLGTSSKLSILHFGECNTLADDLLELRSCPQLVTLELEEKNFDPLIAVIPQLTTLTTVRFLRTHLSIAQVKILATCPRLRHLWLQQSSFTEEERVRYKRFDHRVSFEIY